MSFRFKNMAFLLIVALVLLCAIGNRAYGLFPNVDLKSNSALEGRSYQTLPEATPETLTSGTFQSQAEQFVADSVPWRDTLLLADAKVQRNLIELANVPVRYDAYPTYFGSQYVFCPRTGVVGERPTATSAAPMDDMAKSAAALAEAMDRNADINWVFCPVDRASTSSALPAHSLMSDPFDYASLFGIYAAALPDSCEMIDLSCDDEDDYLRRYYLTDHHWNIVGGNEAHRKISAALGKPVYKAPKSIEAYQGPFWGSATRNGICPEGSGDEVWDIPYPLKGIEVSVNGKSSKATVLDYSAKGGATYEKADRFSNCYAQLFHTDYGIIEIARTAGGRAGSSSEETLLIVGDSYTNCMERFFLESYDRIIVIDPRYYDGTLDELLKTRSVDDAVVMLSKDNLVGEKLLGFLQ